MLIEILPKQYQVCHAFTNRNKTRIIVCFQKVRQFSQILAVKVQNTKAKSGYKKEILWTRSNRAEASRHGWESGKIMVYFRSIKIEK